MGIVHAKAQDGIPKREINYGTCDTTETRELEIEGVKARVDRIHIEGLGRTKDDIIQKVVKDLFSAVDFQDILLKAHQVRTKLDSLGCFRNIAVYIDTSKGAKASPDGVEVTYIVKEYKRVVGGVNTMIGNNEGSLVVGVRAPNLAGRGERVQAEYTYGSQKSNTFNVSFLKPYVGKYNPVFSASVYQSMAEWPSSGYRQLDRGLILDYSFYCRPLLKHNLQWDASIRELSVLSRSSSFDVRENAGVDLKSALRHILSIDARDDVIFPSCGSLFQLTTELAGLGGDVGFFKNDIYLQHNFPVTEDHVFQTTLAAGALKPLGGDMKVGMSDMYYLGGPLSVRGFRTRGIGPHSDGDALGSTWFWSAGMHLYSPLPFRPGKGGFGELFRTHLFLNCGNIGSFTDEDERPIANQMFEGFRMSYGAGIAMRLGHMARVELNYCVPHIVDSNDKANPGVQFGIGVRFL